MSSERVGFGTNSIRDEQIFLAAIQQGYRLFDSADLYNNADVLAEALRKSGIDRKDYFINYKIFPKLGKDEFLRNVDEAIRKFEYVDCIMLHDLIADRGTDEIKEILQALKPYLESGTVKHLGVSNVDKHTKESVAYNQMKEGLELKELKDNVGSEKEMLGYLKNKLTLKKQERNEARQNPDYDKEKLAEIVEQYQEIKESYREAEEDTRNAEAKLEAKLAIKRTGLVHSAFTAAVPLAQASHTAKNKDEKEHGLKKT